MCFIWNSPFIYYLKAESYEHNQTRSSKQRPTTASGRTFINFVSAKQRSVSKKAAGRARQRGNELQKMIEFDIASFDLFDMPPINEYELYMRSFGRTNTIQVCYFIFNSIQKHLFRLKHPGRT